MISCCIILTLFSKSFFKIFIFVVTFSTYSTYLYVPKYIKYTNIWYYIEYTICNVSLQQKYYFVLKYLYSLNIKYNSCRQIFIWISIYWQITVGRCLHLQTLGYPFSSHYAEKGRARFQTVLYMFSNFKADCIIFYLVDGTRNSFYFQRQRD